MPAQKEVLTQYDFQLIRYVPNVLSGEWFNVGVLLYGPDRQLIDARFASEFSRMKCHPLVEIPFLEALRDEFEEHRLAGENFGGYVTELCRNLSMSLDVTAPRSFWGGDAPAEIDRLFDIYVATPPSEGEGTQSDAPAAGTRAALRAAMEDSFRQHYLLGGDRGLRADPSVRFGGHRMRFTFDYSYQPNGTTTYVHGIAVRNEINDAAKLSFVFERLRQREEGLALAAVLGEGVQDDTAELLTAGGAVTWPVAKVDELAGVIRGELGL